MIDYYKQNFLNYMSASPEIRKESKQHWLKCHAENIRSQREDLIIFSAKILANIAIADGILEELGSSAD